MSEAQIIQVSAVVVRDASGAMLTVRKAGTDRFMLPGGKPEPGESALAAAIRECHEELGVEIAADELRSLGSFRAPAANEPGVDVVANVFEHRAVIGEGAAGAEAGIAPAGEIAELRWLDPAAAETFVDLAPLLTDRVLPALASPPARALP